MSYEFYKVLHLFGLILACGAMGALIFQLQLSDEKQFPKRKWLIIVHGVSLLCLLVAGFGLMARTGIIGQWPQWIWVKLAVWFFLGLSPSLALRAPKAKLWLWWALPLALIFAIYSVIHRLG